MNDIGKKGVEMGYWGRLEIVLRGNGNMEER